MEDLLEPLRRDPARSAIFCDFDGTLAEIAEMPADARPLPGAVDVLRDLASRYAVLAIISGRSAHELLRWLGPELDIWGAHGAQRTGLSGVEITPLVAPHRDLMRTVYERAVASVDASGIEGAFVEDKDIMVALHFRATSDREEARRVLDTIAQELANEFELKRAGGRLAYELRPPVELSKKDVVLDASRALDLTAALFAGDDVVDIAGFEALDRLAERGVHTVRVAVRSHEAPPELLERADLIVDGPRDALELLRSL